MSRLAKLGGVFDALSVDATTTTNDHISDRYPRIDGVHHLGSKHPRYGSTLHQIVVLAFTQIRNRWLLVAVELTTYVRTRLDAARNDGP